MERGVKRDTILIIAIICAALSLLIALWTYVAHAVRVCEHRGGTPVMGLLRPLKVVCVKALPDDN